MRRIGSSVLVGLSLAGASGAAELSGEPKLWHRVTLTFEPLLAGRYGEARLRDFASMTSGYSAPGGSRWGDPSEDWSPTPFVPGEPLFPPGTKFSHWDEAHIWMFGRVLTRAAGRDLLELADDRLFGPIGVEGVRWGAEGEVDGLPIRNGCTGLRVDALGLARFGHLFLNGGRWAGRQVVPADWVREATRPQVDAGLEVADTDRRSADGRGVYGFNWWLNAPGPGGLRPMPDASPGTFYAAGLNHNVCVVVPEWEMVVVRLGEDGNPPGGHAATLNAFLRRLGPAVSPLADGP